MSLILNLTRNALRPGFGREMTRKVWVRWRERSGKAARADSISWCRAEQIDALEWAKSIDSSLWMEAEAFGEEQQLLATRKANQIGKPLSGAGFYPLLYFLTRFLRPQVIVETGVAFGFSSRAFLEALRLNGAGHLYSSDFPYFRQQDPERLIGVLVEPDLRDRWTLLVGSDRRNLRRIASSVSSIDLFHYDSDKSYSGRSFAMDTLAARLASNALILFDDIQDNLHFRDWMDATGAPFLVFAFKGKWIGMTGGPAKFYSPTPRPAEASGPTGSATPSTEST